MTRRYLLLSPLLSSMLLLACGGPVGGESLAGEVLTPEALVAETSTGTEALRQDDPPAAVAAPEDTGPFDLKLVGSGFSPQNGSAMHVAVAVMGCGYWVVATGEDHVAQGAFTYQVDEGVLPGAYSGYTLFFWSDNDADGACDVSQGDEVWQLNLTDMENKVVPVAASALQPLEGWECMFFEPVP